MTFSTNEDGTSVVIRAAKADVLQAYSNIFKMSDGSTPSPSAGGDATANTQLSVSYVGTLLEAVGVEMEDVVDVGNDKVDIKVASGQVVEVLLLAIMGNFVSRSSDADKGSLQSSASDTLPRVVVDVYTGKLQLVSSFSTLRAYFLETLLIISVISIARLSLVRKVTAVYTVASDR